MTEMKKASNPLRYEDKTIQIAGFENLETYEIKMVDEPPPLLKKSITCKTITVGWDTEYVQGRPLVADDVCEGDGEDEAALDSNDIVSHQFWFLELGVGLLVLRPTHAEKLSLDEVIRLAHRFVLDRKKGITTLRFISHYSVAELSSTQWKPTVTKRLKNLIAVQKSVTSKQPDLYEYPDHNRNAKRVLFSLHDTNLLSGGQALHDLGQALDLPKVELPNGAIENMRLLLEDDRGLFIRYAMQDSVIASAWFCWLIDEAVDLGLITPGEIPITASHMAGLYLGHALEDDSEHGGLYVLTGRSADEKGPGVRWGYREAAKVSYHGGRNEAYVHGYVDGTCQELDLKSAYPIALACLPDPDWDDIRSFASADNLPGPFALGVAHVRFRFKHDCPAPFFAVESERGLIFPLSGEALVTVTEVWAAHQSGHLEHLEIVNGIVFGSTSSRRVSDAVSTLIIERDRVKMTDPSKAGLMKLIANSIYGKIAQDIRPRKVVDLFRSLKQKTRVVSQRAYSTCQSPFVAAYITAVTRCLVAEIVNKARIEGLRVVNATTDGIQIEGEFLQEWLADLPLYSAVEEEKTRLFGKAMGLIEVKHETQGMVSIRTRMSWGTDSERLSVTADNKQAKGVPIQRGGIQTRDRDGHKLGHREACLDLHRRYLARDWAFTRRSLSGLLSMLPGARGGVIDDLKSVCKTVTISGDYDLKRRIDVDSLKMVSVPAMNEGEVERVYFDTVPWRDSYEAAAAHAAYKAWKERVARRKESRTCRDVLHGVEEVLEFDVFRRLFEIADGQVSDLDTMCREKVAWAMSKEGADDACIREITSFTKKKVQSIARWKEIEPLDGGRHPEACNRVHDILASIMKPCLRMRVQRRVMRSG
ncbi:MAG: hypothetical protein KF858_05030 [Candidatus Sumerlaeia bacterium]|nr:hypothetical protein [Candidatus Sumerlaeia bacterium]